MKLFYAPETCALAAHIVLEEVGARYAAVRVHFDRQEQRSAEFLVLNPMGRVPVLATEHGALTEVPAILGYIAARYPEARITPEGPFELARMHSFNAFLSSTVHPAFAHYARPYRWADDETSRRAISAKAVQTLAECFETIDCYRLAAPWVLGEQYTLADPYLYVVTRWLAQANVEVSRFPRVAQHFERMGRRGAVRRALTAELDHQSHVIGC